MRAAVRALLSAGNDVILDEMPLDESTIPAWRHDLATVPALWVRLTAPMAILESREAARHHGHPGNARGHDGIAAHEQFDLTIDTSTRTPSEIAALILSSCGATEYPADQ